MLEIQSDRQASIRERTYKSAFQVFAILEEEKGLHRYKEKRKIKRHKQHEQDCGF